MLYDAAQFPPGFRPSTLGLEHLHWLVELSVGELVLKLRGEVYRPMVALTISDEKFPVETLSHIDGVETPARSSW